MRKVAFTALLLASATFVGAGSIGACGGDETGGGTTTGHASSSGQGGGTGGQSAGGGGGGISAKDACTDFAKAKCARLNACSNGFHIKSKYGDTATCEFRNEQECEAALLSPDEGETTDDVEACAAALPNEGCVALFDNDPVPECLPKKGTRADGDPCGSPWQCEGAFCEPNRFSTCGSCSPVPLAGSQCADDTECGVGLVCFKSFCAEPVGVDGVCDKKLHPCHTGLSCVGATMTTSGACQPAVNTKGAACDPQALTGPGCNDAAGFYCHPQIKKCERAVLVDAGQPCGVVNDHFVTCKAGAKCRIPDGMAMGTCQAPAGDTQPCNLTDGPGCMTPAVCQPTGDGPDGICTFPDPSVCG